jgi:hypothetical protein
MSTTTIVPSTAPSGPAGWAELASRANDGLEITLLWRRSTGQVRVAVTDARHEDAAELEFEVAGADALAAYHHPFAYAARLGVRLDGALRDSIHPRVRV